MLPRFWYHFRSADASTSVSSRLSVNSSNHSGTSASRLPSLFFCLEFLEVIRTSFLKLVTSLLSWTCWGQILLCRCWRRIATRIGAQPENNKRYEMVGFAFKCLLLFGQSRLLTADSLIGISVVFAEFFQATEQQTFLRVSALVTMRSRSWTKTCASTFVFISPLAVTTAVEFLDLRKVSSSSEFFYCSACALMLLHRLRILALLEILKWARAFPCLSLKSKTKLCPHSWACKYFSESSMLLRQLIFPRICAQKTTPMKRTLLDNPSRWTLLSRIPPICCHVSLENLKACFDPNFPSSRRLDFLWKNLETHNPIVLTPSI